MALASFLFSIGASVSYVLAACISPLLACFGSVFQVFMVLQLALKFDGRIAKIEADIQLNKLARVRGGMLLKYIRLFFSHVEWICFSDVQH